MTSELWISLAQLLLLRSPTVIIGTVGLWLAISRRKRHPRVSTVAGIGFALQLLGVALFLLTMALVPIVSNEGRYPDMAEFFGWSNLVLQFVSLVSLAMISAAIFIDRKPAPDSGAP